MNIVIPVGGKGLRFYQAGYDTYKPFLPIGDKTMIERVIDCVTPKDDHRFLLSIRAEDYDTFVNLKLPNTKLTIDTMSSSHNFFFFGFDRCFNVPCFS